ncbi:hypothetical protein DYH55_22565 [Methylovirgula sp. 4M-Z18]|nr:hypothetical protein DYH55_22565 [Methylovirgula sp. 4M-Z18]
MLENKSPTWVNPRLAKDTKHIHHSRSFGSAGERFAYGRMRATVSPLALVPSASLELTITPLLPLMPRAFPVLSEPEIL